MFGLLVSKMIKIRYTLIILCTIYTKIRKTMCKNKSHYFY